MATANRQFCPDLSPPSIGTYTSRKTALKFIKEHAKWHGYAVSVRRSYGDGKHVHVRCSRGSNRVSTVPEEERKRKRVNTGTGCPLDIRIHQSPGGTLFWTEILNPSHNHAAYPHMEDHKDARKLTSEQMKLIRDQLDKSASTTDIIAQLLSLDPRIAQSKPRRRDVYNVINRLRKGENLESSSDEAESSEGSAAVPVSVDKNISVVEIEVAIYHRICGLSRGVIEMARRAGYAALAMPSATVESVTNAYINAVESAVIKEHAHIMMSRNPPAS